MTSSDDFVHLHTHSTYSMLDGGSSISELVQTAAAMGQSAIGLTDHGTVNGLFDFWRTCRRTGIRPVLGLEAWRHTSPPKPIGAICHRSHGTRLRAGAGIPMMAAEAEGSPI